jgi:VWFA-related protein
MFVHTFRVAVSPRHQLILALVLVAGTSMAAARAQEDASKLAPKRIPFTLNVQRNEVLVRVAVRDRQGRPIRDLDEDNFRIFDNGKRQVITRFSTESTQSLSSSSEAQPVRAEGQNNQRANPAPRPTFGERPNRFVALYLDNLAMDLEGTIRTRKALTKYLEETLQPTDRVAISTSSGQDDVNFTSDRDKLQKGLSLLHPAKIYAQVGYSCPDLSDYEAYLIAEREDPLAIRIATQKVVHCKCSGDILACSNPEGTARAAARSRWAMLDQQAASSLRGLAELVLRMSFMPGQRIILFVSPGFISEPQLQTITQITGQALKAGVVVNAFDSRGLYAVLPGGDASDSGGSRSQLMAGYSRAPAMAGRSVSASGETAEAASTLKAGLGAGELLQFQQDGEQRKADVLAEMADGTGGVFVHNSNDFDSSIREAGGLAQFSYLLAFSPTDLKQDGKYHHLKVELVGDVRGRGLTVQARPGYFAPGAVTKSAKSEHKLLEDQVFSNDEISANRMQITSHFRKIGPKDVQVTVLVHLDPGGLTFQEKDGRSLDSVTFVTAVFGSDGNYLQGTQKTLGMRLSSATLQNLRSTGISLINTFTLPPGSYAVREVIRDQAGLISSSNSIFDIPK